MPDMGALLADLVRFERDYDRESRTMALVARQEAVELARLVSERLALADRLGVVTDASESPFSDELLDRYPVLEERGPDALGRRAVSPGDADGDSRRAGRTARRGARGTAAAASHGSGDVSRHLVLDDGRSQRELMLRERLTVGRDPACDVSDADPRLSRRHAEFSLTPFGLQVKDLESRNGVRVNGRFVKDALLSPGDLVEIGHLRLRFVDDAAVDPAGQALATVSPRPVDQVQVKDGARGRSHARHRSAADVDDGLGRDLASAGRARRGARSGRRSPFATERRRRRGRRRPRSAFRI